MLCYLVGKILRPYSQPQLQVYETLLDLALNAIIFTLGLGLEIQVLVLGFEFSELDRASELEDYARCVTCDFYLLQLGLGLSTNFMKKFCLCFSAEK